MVNIKINTQLPQSYLRISLILDAQHHDSNIITSIKQIVKKLPKKLNKFLLEKINQRSRRGELVTNFMISNSSQSH